VYDNKNRIAALWTEQKNIPLASSIQEKHHFHNIYLNWNPKKKKWHETLGNHTKPMKNFVLIFLRP
jgi:hypothetical protein